MAVRHGQTDTLLTVRDLEKLLKTSRQGELLRTDDTHFSESFFEHGFKPFKKYVDNLANESEHDEITYDNVSVRDALLDFDGMDRMLKKFKPTTVSNYVGHVRACTELGCVAKDFSDAAELRRTAEHWAKYHSGANAARYQAQKKEGTRAGIADAQTVKSADTLSEVLREKDAIIASLREELAAANAREKMLERERQQLWTALLARDQAFTETKTKTKKGKVTTANHE